VTGGGGVDDHEVPAGPALDRLADLPADLADGEDLLHPGGGGGHEVEGLGHRPDPAGDGHLQVEADVLAERRLGVHGHGPHAGVDPVGPEPHRRAFEVAGDVAPAVGGYEEDLLALFGGQQRHRGRDGALAHTALPGEEQEAAP
jgi:hypothetical protein